tara:strand:- start:3782 stop:4177 length:396 start_codon:yes stop_codon:yes gene_type:complete
MKLKFLAGAGLASYNIQDGVIEGVNTESFVEGSKFLGNEETKAAGIFDMFWRDGVKHVVLAQPTKTTDIPWAAREGEWIDANDYDPLQRYVVATNPRALALLASGEAEYWRDPEDGAWTVRCIDTEQEPTP